MASCRDAESWFASPFASVIAEIDIIEVITSYSTQVAVPDWQCGARLFARTSTEMRPVGRSFTEKRLWQHTRRQAFSECIGCDFVGKPTLKVAV
jgi:hypothetical protein